MNRPTVPEVLPMARAYMYEPGHGAGGSLHTVLGDCNVRDADVDFCARWAEEQGDADGVALARLLRRMSKTQRLKLTSLCERRRPCATPLA